MPITPNRAGEKNGRALVTEAEVREMRKKYATGAYSIRDLAEAYGVHRSTIHNVLKRRTWKKVK